MEWRTGGCHCGAIRFRIQDKFEEVLICNCSICFMKGFVHIIVPKEQFEAIQGQESLSVYTFNSGVAKHYFCKTCGITPYYIPRSHPDGFDINARCLDGVDLTKFKVNSFDGKNWEKNIHEIEGFRS